MACLQPGKWLNDEVINAYVSLVNAHLAGNDDLVVQDKKILCLNTFFMSKLQADLDQDAYDP